MWRRIVRSWVAVASLGLGCGPSATPADSGDGETDAGSGTETTSISTSSSSSVSSSTTAGTTDTDGASGSSTGGAPACPGGCPFESFCVEGACQHICDLAAEGCCDPEGSFLDGKGCPWAPPCAGPQADPCGEGQYCAVWEECVNLIPLAECPDAESFSDPVVIGPADRQPTALDADGNGALDLAYWLDDEIQIVTGPDFAPFATVDTAVPMGGFADDMAAGDFDGDGTADDLLLRGGFYDGIFVLSGDGSGAFAWSDFLQTGFWGQASRWAVADYDGNGTDDAVAGSGCDDWACVGLVSTAPGGAVPAAVEEGVAPFVTAVADVADFGANGSFEAIYTTSVDDGLQPRPGVLSISDGTLTLLSPHDDLTRVATGILALDLMSDGKPDTVMVGPSGGWAVVITREEIDGAPRIRGVPGPFGRTAEPLDLDGDGTDDAVVGGSEGILFLRGANDAPEFECHFVLPEPAGSGYVMVADLDGDADDDIAYLRGTNLVVRYAE